MTKKTKIITGIVAGAAVIGTAAFAVKKFVFGKKAEDGASEAAPEQPAVEQATEAAPEKPE